MNGSSQLHRCLSVHTDLAIEAHAAAVQSGWDQQGVQVETRALPGIRISRVEVLDAKGAASIGKPPGTYITMEATGLREHDVELRQQVSELVAAEVVGLLPRNETGSTLVVGLGIGM